MVIGVLRVELRIHDAESLKDKRRVVRSLKDRLHRQHLVSVSEIEAQDILNTAVLGVALAGSSGAMVAGVLDRIETKLRRLHEAEVVEIARDVLHDGAGGFGGRNESLMDVETEIDDHAADLPPAAIEPAPARGERAIPGRRDDRGHTGSHAGSEVEPHTRTTSDAAASNGRANHTGAHDELEAELMRMLDETEFGDGFGEGLDGDGDRGGYDRA